MMRRALFLDRDGVINVDHGYVCRIEDFQFIDGIFELVAQAVSRDYLVVVVTNQAGIGRGYYTEADFHHLMAWVAEQFELRAGRLDKVYFCPFHPTHGIGDYLRDTPMRKPGPGMIQQACAELDIDAGRSMLVGDNLTDMQAGLAAGVGSNLLLRPATASDAPGLPAGRVREITTLAQAADELA